MDKSYGLNPVSELHFVMALPLRPLPSRGMLRVVLDHPFESLVGLSFVMMLCVFGIEMIEEGPPAYEWVRRHHKSISIVKQVLCMVSIPGLIVLMGWTPGMKAKNFTKPGPRWPLAVVVGLFVAFLLYYAAKVFLAGR